MDRVEAIANRVVAVVWNWLALWVCVGVAVICVRQGEFMPAFTVLLFALPAQIKWMEWIRKRD